MGDFGGLCGFTVGLAGVWVLGCFLGGLVSGGLA